MKKVSIISCFILITVFATGSYFIHTCYLNSYKKEFQSFVFANQKETATAVILINPSELYTNSSNIIWEDENKEVLYKGVLYDIVRIENRGLKVALIAVSDKQETALKNDFAALFDLNAHKYSKNPLHVLKNFYTLKCVVSQPTIGISNHYICTTKPSSSHSFIIFPVFNSQETPPPDFKI